MDAQVAPQVVRVLQGAPDAAVGRRPLGDRLRQHLLLHPPDREAGQLLELPPDIKDTWDKLGSRRRRRSTSRASAPSTSPRSSTTAAGEPGEAGSDLPRHGLGPARARGHRQAVLRHRDPAERQQVRRAQLGGLVGRVVHLRAAGSEDRDAAPGLLPHQRGEHGPVRAHPDHRRRGRVRALRRGLHGADLLSDSLLDSAVVEIIVKKNARCRYTTIQNWSNNVYNLVTSAPSPTRERRWSGSTATSARS